MPLDWQTLRDLEGRFGESYYLLDIRRFERNYHEFLGCFRAIYPTSQLGYSYKTNYIPRLCQEVQRFGGYAEVVSRMEYDLAERIGVAAPRILFNGPLKQAEDLEHALTAGAIVNLDCVEEAEMTAALARRMPGRAFTLGLRCNFDIGGTRISRFGLDTAAGDIDRVLRILAPHPQCVIAGLHCHHSTAHRSAESFARRIRGLIELHDAYFKERRLAFLDVGGGYFGKMTEVLRRQFDVAIPSYREYAEAIAPAMAARFPNGSGPELILEPGVAIVSDVLQFVAKVVRLKSVRGRRVALLVGSVHNVKPTGTDKKLSFTLHRKEDAWRGGDRTDLVGYTCMEHDCLYEGYEGAVDIGDYAVFDNMGAYTVVFKPPFIRPNPSIVTYDSETGSYCLSRRAETFDDVFASYSI